MSDFNENYFAEQRDDLIEQVTQLKAQCAEKDAEIVRQSIEIDILKDRIIEKDEQSTKRVCRENSILRTLVSKSVLPCHYCGVDNISKCPRGFPGCALADDLICGEEEHGLALIEKLKDKDAEIKEILAAAFEKDKVIEQQAIKLSIAREALNRIQEYEDSEDAESTYQSVVTTIAQKALELIGEKE